MCGLRSPCRSRKCFLHHHHQHHRSPTCHATNHKAPTPSSHSRLQLFPIPQPPLHCIPVEVVSQPPSCWAAALSPSYAVCTVVSSCSHLPDAASCNCADDGTSCDFFTCDATSLLPCVYVAANRMTSGHGWPWKRFPFRPTSQVPGCARSGPCSRKPSLGRHFNDLESNKTAWCMLWQS